MQYDFRNLLISFKSIKHISVKPDDPDNIIYTEYSYDEAGNRISKKIWKYTGEDPDPEVELESPGTWVLITNDFYIRNTSGAEVAVYNSTAIQFWNIWAKDNVGRINSDSTKQFYLKDHLGSVRVVLNSASTIISSQDLDAWGHEMEGRKYDAGSSSSKYLFTSKERDSESDYDYFGARYYDSRIGRWGGIDVLFEKHIDFTPYNYVLDAPLILFDPNGKQVSHQELQAEHPYFEPGGSTIPLNGIYSAPANSFQRKIFEKIVEIIGIYNILNSTLPDIFYHEAQEGQIQSFLVSEVSEINSDEKDKPKTNADLKEGDAPIPGEIFVDSKVNEHVYQPPKNWNGKKNSDRLYPSKKQSERGWSKFTTHKKSHGGHFNIENEDGSHEPVYPK
ncbi:hypothetical protein BH10BAC5_BH10BAC5_24990 [soil metagenome]